MAKPVDRLIAAGQWLYPASNSWPALLAEDLGIDPRTVRKWVTGKREYPAEHWDDKIVDLMDLHRHRGDLIKLSFFHPEENVATLVLNK